MVSRNHLEIKSKILLARLSDCLRESSRAADVPKAVLQGLTFNEIEHITGEPRKQIAFTIPNGTARHLRCVQAFRHFDERVKLSQTWNGVS